MDKISLSDCRPEVQAFAVIMEQQLRNNDHKRGWKNDDPYALWKRMGEEADELDALLWEYRVFTPHVIDPQKAAAEAADIANFAMMIADVCGGLEAS